MKEELKPAKGLVYGLIFGAIFWLLIGTAVYFLAK